MRIHGYNVPSRVSVLGRPFSRTTNGSIDDLCLQDRPVKLPPKADSQQCPSTVTVVVQIFAEILVLDGNNLTAESDFFYLGGDSMKAWTTLVTSAQGV